MNCVSDIGNEAKYNKELCNTKDRIYMGIAGVVMTENYIAMFASQSTDEVREIMKKADSLIENIVAL